MIWSEKIKDVGQINPNKPYKFYFHYEGDHKIKNIKPICNCTKIVFRDNTLVVTLKLTKETFFTKTIVVRYDNDEQDFLILKGQVKK